MIEVSVNKMLCNSVVPERGQPTTKTRPGSVFEVLYIIS